MTDLSEHPITRRLREALSECLDLATEIEAADGKADILANAQPVAHHIVDSARSAIGCLDDDEEERRRAEEDAAWLCLRSVA